DGPARLSAVAGNDGRIAGGGNSQCLGAPTRRKADMIEVGEIIPTRTIVVRPESMPVWAAALRDPNPIHLDANATRAAGLGDRVINQGPANIGYLVNALLARFPNGRIVAMDFVFLDNVRGGDMAAATGKVVRV